MNNKCHLLLLLMVFLLFGCGERSQLVYDPPVFKNKYQATTEIFNDSFIFTTCKKILTTEEWVILIDHTMDHMIHLFDKKTGELKLSTGTRGNGPGELIAPEEFSLDRKRNILYIHDSAKRRILKYALDKLICGEKDFFEEILIGEEIIDFVTIHFLKDSLFVANGDEHQLNIITPNTIVSSSSEDSCTEPFESQKEWNAFVNMYAAKSVNPSGDRVVNATMFGGVMQFYRLSKDLDNVTFYKSCYFYPIRGQRTSFNFIPNEETTYGFFYIDSTDSYVYATAFGIKNPVHTPTTIWQLDWEGNPVAAYETGYHIANFTVDEATNHIYACVYKDDEQVLAVIDLNNK